MPLPKALTAILNTAPALRKAYLVGGCVRDGLLGVPVKDYDIEVFGVSYPNLVEALSQWGRAELVGRSFGTVKLRLASGLTLDFAIPRGTTKGGLQPADPGAYDPRLSPAEAARRRDFTINALMYDPRSHQVLDFVGGLEDLRHLVLRHTSDAFCEDPLRVLRGMQLAARFNLEPAPETVELCRQMKGEYGTIAEPRIWEEWQKWATKSTVPSAGLRFLVATEWVDCFPELGSLRGTPQNADWHPEGDVFVHSCHSCDAMVSLPGWQAANLQAKAVYLLATLAHDFGKPSTTRTVEKRGRVRIVSPGHDRAGVLLAEAFLHRIHAPKDLVRRVLPLVKNHLAHLQAPTERAVRRLAQRLVPETIHGLTLVMMADHMGRPPKPASVPESVRALERKAAALRVAEQAPRPVLMGRHLLALGMSPGPAVGSALADAYDAQLDGAFVSLEEAVRWLAAHSHLSIDERAWERLRDQASLTDR